MDLDRSLPTHVPEQIALYQTEHLLTQPVCRFDPAHAASQLDTVRNMMAIDIGGDKLRCATYAIGDGKLTKLEERVLRSTKGTGYLPFLEQLAAEAVAKDLPVGISSATKLAGSIIQRTVNLPVFFEEFRERYGADYENLFPGRSFVCNDTIAGICGSSTILVLQRHAVREVAFFICGSGMGASVIKDHTAIHVEVAHVPLVDRLNPLGQTTPCGVEGRDFVCVERVTAARAGIEDLYRQRIGESKDGIALGKMYTDGDALATVLYETSALTVAHATAGVMIRYGFADSDRTVAVFHGGNFEIEKYREAVKRNLMGLTHPQSRIVFSRDLSKNVCLDGAAILAVNSAGASTEDGEFLSSR